MQINHLPAVKTRCCSAMPFFSFLFFYPPFFFSFIIIILFGFFGGFFEFHSFKQNIGNPLKVSKLQPGVVLIGTNVFSI